MSETDMLTVTFCRFVVTEARRRPMTTAYSAAVVMVMLLLRIFELAGVLNAR